MVERKFLTLLLHPFDLEEHISDWGVLPEHCMSDIVYLKTTTNFVEMSLVKANEKGHLEHFE
jgi:hypothetical protein